ncbi:hypothetical protein LguiA_024365 [Lonicera macranthoides]
MCPGLNCSLQWKQSSRFRRSSNSLGVNFFVGGEFWPLDAATIGDESLASYSRASPTVANREEDLAACTLTQIASFKPLTKHPICWEFVNGPARIRSFSYCV